MKLINLQVHSKEECEDDYFSPDAARDAGMKPNDLRKQIPQVRYILQLRPFDILAAYNSTVQCLNP